MNPGTYKWQLYEPRLAKWKDQAIQVNSNMFQIAKLNWKAELCLNGYTEKSKGLCGVCVRLLEMPFSWKSIFCQLHIECPQIQNKMVFSVSYNEAKSKGCYLSSFEDLKASCDKDLTFVITIRIARITLKEDNKILLQVPTNKYKTKAHLQWKIDEEMMRKLKSFDRGKGICSDIYNNIWCLKLYPNGNVHSKEGDVRIGLYLCGLPPHMYKLNVQWTVHCREANLKQTFTFDFDEENTGYSWYEDTISFAQFCKYNTWTVSVAINVLNEFDMNDEEGTMKRIESDSNEYKRHQNNTDLKGKLQFYDVAIESLSTNVQQIQNTLRSISKTLENQNHMMKQITERVSNLEESKEEHAIVYINSQMNKMTKEISVLQEQMNEVRSAGGQAKPRANSDHEKVRKWLKNEVGLELYYALFIANGYKDLVSIQSLNMEALNRMEIEKSGHKMKILRCVADLNHTQTEGNTRGNVTYF
eukprot:322184_1